MSSFLQKGSTNEAADTHFPSTWRPENNGAPGNVCVDWLGDEGEERIRAAYPHGAYERLAQVKAKYDPNNLFLMNQNVKPA